MPSKPIYPPKTCKTWQNLHKLAILLIFVSIVVGVFAFQVQQTTFSDGNSTVNLSLVEYTNYTIYIDIPSNAYLKNMSIYFEGVYDE